jgi:hypothetical protein
MSNPYEGQAGYDGAWQQGYDFGLGHPTDTNPPPPEFGGPVSPEYEGYMQQVWREGVMSGQEDAARSPVIAPPAPPPGVDGGSPAPTSDQPSWESRERDREVDRVTRDAQPGDVSSWFQSDWAGRAILSRYLTGEGDWDIREDPAWSEYMRSHASLRHKLEQHARYLIANTAALGSDEGVVNVNEAFAVNLENGEGIVGYQYLHGTNADAGGFTIYGWARMVPGPSSPSDTATSGARRVHYYLTYTWNDIIDPNLTYSTDAFKAGVAYFISAGTAASYRIAIEWHGEAVVTVDSNGHVTDVATTSDSGDPLNGYPLR